MMGLLAEAATGISGSIDPNAVIGSGTQVVALGCLIWVVRQTLGISVPSMQAAHAAAMEKAQGGFLLALENTQREAAEERKSMVSTMAAMQKEYIQQLEFQRKQCTEEHVAKDRIIERLMARAGLSKEMGS